MILRSDITPVEYVMCYKCKTGICGSFQYTSEFAKYVTEQGWTMEMVSGLHVNVCPKCKGVEVSVDDLF